MKEAYWCPMISLVLFFIASLSIITPTEAGVIGVNYGTLGDNLPTPAQTISLLKSKNITRVRIFSPNHEILSALSSQGIELVLGTLNQDLQPLALDPSFSLTWVLSNVVPYAKTVPFRYISAGNEVVPGDLDRFVLPAMQNLKKALESNALTRKIPVTTTVATSVLGKSYPPSLGEFSADSAQTMAQIAAFLSSADPPGPLLVNVYPYFSYVGNPKDISLPYALLDPGNEAVVRDGALEYRSLFDSAVDAVYSALERAAGGAVEVVVSETGWPSSGGDSAATVGNAAAYNNNLIRRVAGGSGTPKRPGKSIEAYIFAVYNENLKPAGTEQNFGLFYPNMTEVYRVDFSGKL